MLIDLRTTGPCLQPRPQGSVVPVPTERERDRESDGYEREPGNEVAVVCSPLGKIHLTLHPLLTGRFLHAVVAVHKFERQKGGHIVKKVCGRKIERREFWTAKAWLH